MQRARIQVGLRKHALSLLPIAALVASLGCASLPSGRARPGCPVVPVGTDRLVEPVDLRARVQLKIRDQNVGLEIVAREQDGDLVVVGLSDYGSRLFSVRQTGSAFEVEAGDDAQLSALALFLFDALQRAYWIAPRPFEAAGTAPRHFQWADEYVEDVSGPEGRSRFFARSGPASASPSVAIHYSDGPDSAGNASPRVEIRNDWCDYDAIVAPLGPRPK